MKLKKQPVVNDLKRFIWKSTNKLTPEDIKNYVELYLQGEFRRVESYHEYYSVENPYIVDRHHDRYRRGKTPNNLVPTAYYKTLVDTEAGYMFNNVQYNTEDETFDEALMEVLDDNNVDIKDMQTGINALYCNKGIELVYTVGDGKNPAAIKYTSIDPRQMIVIYNQDIEPKEFCGIYITMTETDDYNLDVIYADEWQYYFLKDGEISQREEPRQLFFEECPVCVYNANLQSNKPPFHQVIPYIDVLDYLITGNSNEIEKLVDAFLILGQTLTDEQLANMDEIKVFMDMRQEDRAEYITKDMSPEFREYVSRFLIQEIHKHGHVLDYYSPDTGATGEASGRALLTRLFDMEMNSQRIEKTIKEGAEKRIRLISFLLNLYGVKEAPVKIVYNRTMPSMLEEKAQALKDVSFISDYTKLELIGLDPEVEKERKAAEQPVFEPVEPENDLTDNNDDDTMSEE